MKTTKKSEPTPTKEAKKTESGKKSDQVLDIDLVKASKTETTPKIIES